MDSFEYSPDGTTLVYVSDERSDDVHELFAVPADGSAPPLVLSGALVDNGDVSTPGGLHSGAFALAPDGTWAAYLADASTDGLFELHRTSLDGSASPLELSGALVAGGDVTSFQISADGAFVLFLADALTDEQFELFSAPSDGSTAPVRLNSAFVAGGDVSTFALGSLSARAYFLADGALDGVTELHSVPLDASLPAVRLNDALAAGRAVLDFRIAADESRVAYRADGAADDVIELYSVPADRSAAPVKLNPTPVAGGDVGTSYEIGAARVAYLADQETNDVSELYSVPLDGSAAATKLHPGSSSVTSFRFTPDGTLVLFSGEVAQDRGLFRVPAAGGTPVRLGAVFPWETVHTIEISADGEVCLYVRNTPVLAYYSPVGMFENLYCVDVSGGTPRQLTFNGNSGGFQEALGAPQLNTDATRAVYVQPFNSLYVLSSVPTDASSPPVPLAAATNFEPSPTGTHAALLLDFDSGSAAGRLATIALDGSQSMLLSGPTLLGAIQGDVHEFEPTPDGLQVAYRASYQDGIHVVGVGGGTPSVELAATSESYLPFTPLADSIVHAPDSRHLAFIASERLDGGYDLFAATLRGPGAPVRVNEPAIDGGGLALHAALRPRFTPDGTRLVYAAGITYFGQGDYALFVAPIDGSLPPTRLNGTGTDKFLWDGGSFSHHQDRAFALSPDGTRVVYSARGSAFRLNLFSVPLDASAPPVQLSSLTVAGTNLYGNWEITPDGARVVYMTDQEVRLRSELYSAPLDGSTAAVKLNPPLVSGGAVGFYGEGVGLFPYARITPDGARVVYLADQEIDGQDELYSVPSDGSGPAVKVSGALVSGGDAKSFFQLSPDGTKVVYAADALSDEVVELFVAPLDASAAPLRLSGNLVAGGDVSVLGKRDGLVQFAGGRVVYAADALVNDVVELFSVPLDGSASPVRLSAPMTSGGDVDPDTLLVTADGLTVIYRADQATNDVFELWRVPVDGSAAPERVNLPLPSGGDVSVRGVRVLPRGNRILYRADQEVDEQFELYTLRLLPRTPRGPAVPPPISGTVTRDL